MTNSHFLRIKVAARVPAITSALARQRKKQRLNITCIFRMFPKILMLVVGNLILAVSGPTLSSWSWAEPHISPVQILFMPRLAQNRLITSLCPFHKACLCHSCCMGNSERKHPYFRGPVHILGCAPQGKSEEEQCLTVSLSKGCMTWI